MISSHSVASSPRGVKAGVSRGRGREPGAAGPAGGLRPAGVRREYLRGRAAAGGHVVRGAVGARGKVGPRGGSGGVRRPKKERPTSKGRWWAFSDLMPLEATRCRWLFA